VWPWVSRVLSSLACAPVQLAGRVLSSLAYYVRVRLAPRYAPS